MVWSYKQQAIDATVKKIDYLGVIGSFRGEEDLRKLGYKSNALKTLNLTDEIALYLNELEKEDSYSRPNLIGIKAE